MAYGKVTPEIVQSLRRIAGPGNVLAGRDAVADYGRDEMVSLAAHYPDVVVLARSARAVSAVMGLASRKRIPVTPRGAGTGLSGGCVPLHGGIVLSLAGMDRILEVDPLNFTATVQPGVTLEQLTPIVEAAGLYYPLYPGEKSATIGGNVATNAGGMRAVKYGVTRNFVLGVEAVLPGGETVRAGGKFVKCSTGYDLTQLLVGSEGTLAVITRITVRLMLVPRQREVLLAPFPSLAAAIGTVPKILAAGIVPAGMEFLQDDVVGLVERYTGQSFPLRGYPAYLLMIVEAGRETELLETLDRIGSLCRENGAPDIHVPAGQRARRLLEFREKFYPAVRGLPNVQIADVVVPRSRVADFVAEAKGIASGLGITVLAYGHAGDGNVHLHPYNAGLAPDEWELKQRAFFKQVFRAGAAMGGAISGEHGLGYAKKGYLGISAGRQAVALMRRIKRAFDPDNIMNPGKVIVP